MSDHRFGRFGSRIGFAKANESLVCMNANPEPIYSAGVNCDPAVEANGFNFGDVQAEPLGGAGSGHRTVTLNELSGVVNRPGDSSELPNRLAETVSRAVLNLHCRKI